MPDDPTPNLGAPALCGEPHATDAEQGGSLPGVAALADRPGTPPGTLPGVGVEIRHAPLCARIARGDRDAFAEFYAAWFDRALAMARGITRRDESFCLDVVQDAMLRVVRAIRPMQTDADVARWMVRTVHSSAIDMLRRESRAARRDRTAARQHRELDTPDPHTDGWLERALASLDNQERTMLALRFGRDATLDAVGQAIGTTGDAAHGRIRRLLGRLRAMKDPP